MGSSDSKSAVGDILYRPLPGVAGFVKYCHYGIYVGKNEVIHYTQGQDEKGIIEKVSLKIFANGCAVSIQTSFPTKRRSKRNTALKALELYYMEEGVQNWTDYHYLNKNCEHFANFCATGEKWSTQSYFTRKKIK